MRESIITIRDLGVSYDRVQALEHVDLDIYADDFIGIIGPNGGGKSTLLKLLAGLQQPTSGHISMPSGLTIGYLPQHMIHAEGTTVMEETQKAFQTINELQARIDRAATQLAERTDYESAEYQDLIEQMSHDNEMLQVLGGGNFAGELEKTLIGLGFLRSDFDRPCSEFSGGWRMRIELAKILLQRPDIFLLDEPTNHLDIESIYWLENFLANYQGAVILVSHDRAFIDNVTTRTIEISLGHIYDYDVNYSKYVVLRQERREQQIRAYENQQKMIADTEEFIERFRYKATKAVQVQSRIKQLEKIDRIEVDLEDNSRLHLKFPPAPRSGDFPLILTNVGKAYGEHQVFDNVEFTIKRGEKVAFVGKNGEGKSTLVKCIMGELQDYTGTLKIGHNIKIGYFAQNQASLLDENKTVFETIDYVAVGDIRTKIRDILGAFMFGGEASDKKVKVLSGGERSRLAMIRLLLEPVNLLILDEPTNHLDMRSKDVLKEAIKAFDGTVIVVSHDREFLDGLVTKVYEFGNQRIKEHLGGIYDFLQSKNMTHLSELELTQQTKKKEEKVDSQNKISYEARKEQARQLRKQERLVEEAEKTVSELEQQLAQIEAQLAQPQAPDSTLLSDYQSKQHLLEQKMYEWELLSEQLEDLKRSGE